LSRGSGSEAGLVAEPAHGLGRGADEGDAGGGAGLGEVRALREEPVAGVDRVGLGLAGDPQHLGDREIGFDRAEALADLVGLVGLEAVEGELVFLREDRDGLQSQLIGRAEDADRDLRAVCDENLADCHAPCPVCLRCLRHES